ncbi:MAG: septum formation initiator family protein [Pseudomonadota bacterium]|nr:septum formation initiator family protein [Pseudomonadota bacterium]
MRPLLLALLGLLLLLQYRLWFGEGGIRERQELETQVRMGEVDNQLLRERNDALARQVLELQDGDEMLEAIAREELGLVRQGEEFILFINDDTIEKSP